MGKTVREIVAEQVLKYGQEQGLKGYIDNACEDKIYVVFTDELVITIIKSYTKGEHFINIERVIYPVNVNTVKLRKIEQYTWAVTGSSKRITADIIDVINELL